MENLEKQQLAISNQLRATFFLNEQAFELNRS
jgi:hypothetical protein